MLEQPTNAALDNTAYFKFDITRLRLQFRALELVRLPEFAGSTWRGALGQALRRVACVYSTTTDCRNCILNSACWYARLYQPAIEQRCSILQGYSEAPHPLIPEAWPLGGELVPEAEARLDLVLIGQAKAAVPVLLQAAQRMADHGLGRGRGRLQLEHWEMEDPSAAAADPWSPVTMWPQVRMRLETPLRLRVNNRILNPQSLEMRPIATTLLRRISLLACCHSTAYLDVDFKNLAAATAQIAITARQLRWFKWARYSSTQTRHVDMDGVVGELVLDLSLAPEWWPHLWLGQWLHLGKGTSMGLGSYRLSLFDPSEPGQQYERSKTLF